MALSLAACSNTDSTSDAAPASEGAAAEETAVSREEVEPILNAAIEADYASVTFASRTDTSATGTSSNGQSQTQTMRTSMRGELDRSGEAPALHIDYEAQSNMSLGKTQYEMFIDSENLIVSQGGQLYVDAMSEEVLDGYANSVTAVTSAEEIGSILDMAGGLKMEQVEGDTVITVTVDKDKLLESDLVDTSSLPETSQIATMVVNYVIDSDSRFKTVRLMSSTTGTPTYRVQQTYSFSKYDETELPEWPDLNAYAANQSGIMTDASGRMYIVGDDGQIYYVTEIGDDGMIYYDTGASSAGGSPSLEPEYYYVDVDDATATGTSAPADTSTSADATEDADTSTGGGDTTSDRGRAYITADDGTIHYLDEEGSRLFENDDGTSYFIDADGNFYFLSYGDDE